MSSKNLVAVVTGASRGLGRGIARALGSKKATVYITGRDLHNGLQAAAGEITAAGGTGIAVQCDHRDDSQVAAFFAQVAKNSGRLDILVNNAAAVYPDALRAPGGFWEKPLVGLRSAYVASYHAAPLMVAAKKGLIANISFYGAVSYFHGPAYGATKAATDKMSFDMAIDLKPHGVSAVSIWPGFIRTEIIAAIPADKVPPELAQLWPLFEHPEFTGLVIEALSLDPALAELSGQALIGAELGERYGILDLDGKRPVSFRQSMGAPRSFPIPEVLQ
jgi:NAD(P)-dependent dehydrogenase (short-subunit alcohol dehydrogenase family)